MIEPADWPAFAADLLGLPAAEVALYRDPARAHTRIALYREGHLAAAFFSGPEPVEAARAYLIASLGGSEATERSHEVLAGRGGGQVKDAGAIVCACFQVGINTILGAITERSLATVDEIGAATRAGTNRGSCRAKLAALLSRVPRRIAAE